MKSSITKDRLKKISITFLVALFWILLWAAVYKAVDKELLLPSPKRVAARFLELCGTFSFWKTLLTSCLRVAAGFIAAFIAGTIMGALCVKFSFLHLLFSPVLKVITTTPVASFIILALVWISSDRLPVFIIFLMVLPLVWNNVYQGIKNVDKDLVEMVNLFELSWYKKLKALYIPSTIPYISATINTGIGFAWKAGVAAEVLSLPQVSVGRQIYNSKVYFETTDLFAWTIAAILLSFALEKLGVFVMNRMQKRVMRGYKEAENVS